MRGLKPTLGTTVAVLVLGYGGWAAYRWLWPASGDDHGIAFRQALTDEIARTGLEKPVRVDRLARFSWDRVSIVPQYSTGDARKIVGDGADDLPRLGEDQNMLIFIEGRRLAGWVVLDAETDRLVGASTRACLYNLTPVRRQDAYLTAFDGRLAFTTPTGRPVPGTLNACLADR